MVRCKLLATFAIASGLALGCAEEEAGAGTITVGFSQVGGESSWRAAESESIRGAARERGIRLKFADAQEKQENQFKALKGFMAQGVDAIVLAPKVKSGWEPILREIKAEGIPVVLVDRGIDVSDESLYATLIASDFVEEGRMAARWLAKATGGEASIVELEGTPGSDPANDRKRGFAEIVAKHPDMKILRSQSGDFKRSKGKEVMEAFLKSLGREIDAVYAHNDDMALGAIQAIEEAGLKPGKDILIVSIDGVRGAFEAMEEGKLNATVECNPLLGPMVFDAIENIIHNGDVPKRITVEDRLYEQSEAAGVLPTRQY